MFVKSVYDFEKKIESLNIHKVSVATWYLLKFYLNIAAPICYKLTKRKEQKRNKAQQGCQNGLTNNHYPAVVGIIRRNCCAGG